MIPLQKFRPSYPASLSAFAYAMLRLLRADEEGGSGAINPPSFLNRELDGSAE